MTARRAVASAAAALTLALAGGCTAGHGSPTPGPAPAHPTGTTAAAVRWWSDGAHAAGSTIDAQHPTAGASALHPSRTRYCAVLRETVRAGRSILPGAGAGDPAVLASAEAFAADLQHLAPTQLTAQWQVLGDALVAFVRSDGRTLGPGTSATAISRAATAISADAKAHCGLDLATSAR